MSKNTDLSDINEIMMGYYINNEKWFDPEAKKQVESKKEKVEDEEYEEQVGKAKVMSEETLAWAKSKGYGNLKKVYWTARPGVLQEIVDPKNKIGINSKKNPTDILLEFSNGPSNGFLGVSAKSTKGKSDIGFKNPGMGTIENNLKIDLSSIVDKKIEEAVKMFKLSKTASVRKQEIRKNKKIQQKTEEMGTETLRLIRDKLYKKLDSMNNKDLRTYILSDWLDATELYPPYIKVTGMGNKEPYSAKIEDPLKNEKLAAINSQNIKVEKVGNDSVGVSAGNKKILKMRAKFESEKLASSVKFSGDPW
jgi:hypothetical protein